MPFEEGLKWGKELVKHSAASFGSPLTYAGYKDLPMSYLVCDQMDFSCRDKICHGVRCLVAES